MAKIFCVLILTGLFLNTALNAETVARWKFDKIEDNKIKSVDGKHTAIVNNASGKIEIIKEGQRAFLRIPGINTNDYVTLGSSSTFDLRESFSLEAWFRPVKANASKAYTMIVGNRYSQQFQLDWTFLGGGTIEFYAGGGDMKLNRAAKGRLKGGYWMHMVATYDASAKDGVTQKLYLNGKLISSCKNPCGKLPACTQDIRLGQNSMLNFNNKIEADWGEVAIYNHVLTLEEIKKAYEAGSVKTFKPLKKKVKIDLDPGHWRLRRGSRESSVEFDRLAGSTVVKDKADGGRKTSCRKVKNGALRFTLNGNATERKIAVWHYMFPEATDLRDYRYCLIGFRSACLERSHQQNGVLQLSGSKPVTLITANEMVLDGKSHILLRRINAEDAALGIDLTVITRDSRAWVEIGKLCFYRELPAAKEIGRFDAKFSRDGFISIDLSSQYNGTLIQVADRLFAGKYPVISEPMIEYPAEKISIAGIPFTVKRDGANLVWPGPQSKVNEQLVDAFGQKVRRKYFFPEGRDNVITIPVNRKCRELFMLMATNLPASRRVYALPPEPGVITDIEGIAIDLEYADGKRETVFPYSMSAEGYRVSGMGGVYAVPADPGRMLKSLKLHNMVWDVDAGVSAVTVNISEKPVLPQLHAEPELVQTPAPESVREVAPQIAGTKDNITVFNAYYRIEIGIKDGFSISAITNKQTKYKTVLSPDSGLEIIVGKKAYSGRDFTVKSVKISEDKAYLELESKGKNIPLKLNMTISPDSSRQLKFSLSAVLTEKQPLAADIRFPALKGLRLGTVKDSWYFFPQYRNVIGNETIFCKQTNSRAFTMQFFGAYNPRRGGGIALMSRNLELEPVNYCLSKNSRGINLYLENDAEDNHFQPGVERKFCDRAIIVHGGDWHQAAAVYKNWTKSWYRPVNSQNRAWFRQAVWGRSHILSPKISKNINKTLGLMDPETKTFRLEAMLKADREYLDIKPDIFHFYCWSYDAEVSNYAEMPANGEYGEKSYANLGGLDNFRKLIVTLQKCFGMKVSIYTIWDRVDRDTEFFRKYGDKFVRQSADGRKIETRKMICTLPSVPVWMKYASGILKRLSAETGTNALYLDVFGSSDVAKSYNPNTGLSVPTQISKGELNFLKTVRKNINPNVALWGECSIADVACQYWDGFITYVFIPLHVYLAKSYDQLESAPKWSSRTLSPNLFRFMLPKLRQAGFPVGTEGYVDNWCYLKFLLFNGQMLFDTTWRLFTTTCRKNLERALKIQKKYIDCFSSDNPEMFVPVLRAQVFANKFPGKKQTVWTLFNGRYRTLEGNILAIDHVAGAEYFDLWNNRPLKPEIRNGKAIIKLTMRPQQIGCILQKTGK